MNKITVKRKRQWNYGITVLGHLENLRKGTPDIWIFISGIKSPISSPLIWAAVMTGLLLQILTVQDKRTTEVQSHLGPGLSRTFVPSSLVQMKGSQGTKFFLQFTLTFSVCLQLHFSWSSRLSLSPNSNGILIQILNLSLEAYPVLYTQIPRQGRAEKTFRG